MTGGWRRMPRWLGGLHFSVVEPGVLSRSAMPTPEMIDWLASELGVRSVVSFREEEEGEWEETRVAGRGMRFFYFDMGSKRPPTPWQLERWRSILADPDNRPIHCHCHGGADRTGLMVALYRIEHQDWTVERALREVAARGGVLGRSSAQRRWLLHTYREARALRPARRPGWANPDRGP
jgi:protein tyrosine/serine phosphatase